MATNDVGHGDESKNVTLFDARLTAGSSVEAFSERLEQQGLRADFLSPVAELSARVTWVADLGYLDFFSYSGISSWDVYGDADRAEWQASAEPPLPSLEIWFTNLPPALYLLVVEVSGGVSPLGPGGEYFRLGTPGGSWQTVAVTNNKQYLGTLFLQQAANPNNLAYFPVKTINQRGYTFYRATLINVFG